MVCSAPIFYRYNWLCIPVLLPEMETFRLIVFLFIARFNCAKQAHEKIGEGRGTSSRHSLNSRFLVIV